jgi:hypothetical protein
MLYFFLLPFFILLHLPSAFQFYLHPFHVSVCTIYYNEEEKSLQITHKIFVDDLENTLNNAGYRTPDNDYIDVLNPADQEFMEATIEKYLRAHFSITLNSKEAPMNYLGSEQEGLALWCYMEIAGVEKIDALNVKYTVLLEAFTDQINLVHVNYKGAIKSLRLDHDQESENISFGAD